MLLALRVFMRAVHLIAASAWLGGSIFYLVVLLPASRSGGTAPPALAAQTAALFRRLVNACMGVLLVTGVYLTFDRLTSTSLGVAYLVTLGLKITVALAMFGLALYQAQEGISRARRGALRKAVPRLILALGLLAFLLGALLTGLFESASG
jgi:uncharacterized membrane protein